MESRSGPAESAPCDGAANVLAHEGCVGCGKDTGAPDHFANRRVAAHVHLALVNAVSALFKVRRHGTASVSVGGGGRLFGEMARRVTHVGGPHDNFVRVAEGPSVHHKRPLGCQPHLSVLLNVLAPDCVLEATDDRVRLQAAPSVRASPTKRTIAASCL